MLGLYAAIALNRSVRQSPSGQETSFDMLGELCSCCADKCNAYAC